MMYDFVGVLLFTFYIVYDTQLIIGGSHKVQFSIDDYCFAALNLYLDVINLFQQILRLLGDQKKDKKDKKTVSLSWMGMAQSDLPWQLTSLEPNTRLDPFVA